MPSSYSAIISRYNRNLLPKRTIRKYRDMLREHPDVPDSGYKEVSPEELERIKAEIRKEAVQEYRYRLAISGVAFLVLFALLAGIAVLFF